MGVSILKTLGGGAEGYNCPLPHSYMHVYAYMYV